jgi:hypothetical protein
MDFNVEKESAGLNQFSAGFENGVGGFEDAMHALLGDFLAMKPVLDIAPAEFRTGQTQGFTADQGDTLGLHFAEIAWCLFVAVAHPLQFLGVTEHDGRLRARACGAA